MKTLFFFCLETTAEKTFEFPISAEKSLSIAVKTFFFVLFGDHGGKNVRISNFGRKITFNFGEDLFFFFFLETTAEKTFEFPISAEKSLSISVKTSEFLRVCA